MAEKKENKKNLIQLVREQILLNEELDTLKIISPTLYYHLERRGLFRRNPFQTHEREVGGGTKWYT